ncbi:MAG: hypothetical protein JWP15_2887 [Alphaproteobacteria bacterium]|nr:hypothetical protein [Alphaproteobacteria bacterium]
MTRTVARLIMTVATLSLGAHRSAWGQAMLVELEAAEADDRALGFAFGCLIGAWRTMPEHAEGRFVLTSYALSLGLIIPIAAVLVLAGAFGFPFVDAGGGMFGFLSGSGTQVLLLNAGTEALGPALTLVMLLLAACHLPLAWWVLDRDWDRVVIALCFAAASITTLAIVTSCAALDPKQMLLPASALALETIAMSILARWHARLFGGDLLEKLGPRH